MTTSLTDLSPYGARKALHVVVEPVAVAILAGMFLTRNDLKDEKCIRHDAQEH